MTWVTTFILPIVSASEISIYSVIGNVSSTQVPLIGIIEKVKNAWSKIFIRWKSPVGKLVDADKMSYKIRNKVEGFLEDDCEM